MKNRVLAAIVPLTLALFAIPALACEQHATSAYETMSEHYLAIQIALASDSLDGVAESAIVMASTAGALLEDFDRHAAGVDADHAGACRDIMPDLRASAESLSQAKNLADAREAFGSLSASIVVWHGMVADPELKVAYCSMADKHWLQSGTEIANPFYGSSMLRCGKFVAD